MKKVIAILSFTLVASSAFAGELFSCIVAQKGLGTSAFVDLTNVDVDANNFKTTSGSAIVNFDDATVDIEISRHEVPKPYSGVQYFIEVSAKGKDPVDSVSISTKPGVAFKVKSGNLDLLVSCAN